VIIGKSGLWVLITYLTAARFKHLMRYPKLMKTFNNFPHSRKLLQLITRRPLNRAINERFKWGKEQVSSGNCRKLVVGIANDTLLELR